MARERSEDAVTWNVFRHLEKRGQLVPWLTGLLGGPQSNAQVHYWSFDSVGHRTWQPLADARLAFGEARGRGSEPDLIITTEDSHVWVEAKLGSSNDTRPSEATGARNRYTAGGGGWYASVVKAAFDTVAVERRRYELLRLWLLGSWAAAREGKRFVLLNLVREGCEEDVPRFSDEYLVKSPERFVVRATWESIYLAVGSSAPPDSIDRLLLRYLRDKTLGYGGSGRLLRALAVT